MLNPIRLKKHLKKYPIFLSIGSIKYKNIFTKNAFDFNSKDIINYKNNFKNIYYCYLIKIKFASC